MTKQVKFFIGIIIVIILVAVVYIFGRKEQAPPENVELTFWNLWDDSDSVKDAIVAYKAKRPWVTINYYKRPYAGYEEELVDMIAEGKGPDIFTIHNTWVPKHQGKLSVLPTTLMPVGTYRDTFADVAVQDFIVDEQIYAIPLSIDTLALYYNKDFFNSANIPFPPTTWNDFNEDVKKLTLFDEKGDITRAGATIGAVDNVNRAVDILSLLMLQQGSDIVDKTTGKVTFNKSMQSADGTIVISGLDALKFYTSFSNPLKSVYTWNPNMDYSVDAFAYGKAAMMLGYSYHNDTIKFKNPGLNFGVTEMPQINSATSRVNYANYWAETVWAGSKNQEEAWKFLLFLAERENLQGYLEKTNKPTSRRDMVALRSGTALGIFDGQILSAKSWYEIDNVAIENYLADMLRLVVQRKATEDTAMRQAADQIELLMKKY